ncbi:hypothetical protein OAJ61_00455 [bacterium]|nr:hypothetical protein [bacterium]
MIYQHSHSVLTAILYSSEDAKKFLFTSPNVDRVFVLTPDARATMKNTHIPLLTTLDTYTEYRQRRAIARVRRMERNIENHFQHSEELSIAAKETLNAMLHVLAMFSARLWETLKGTGPWLILQSNGWEKIDNLQEAHRNLLVQIASQTPIASLGYDRSMWSPIIKILNRGILKITNNKKFVLVTGYKYGLNSLAKELNQTHREFTVLAVSGSSGKFREILKSVLNFTRILVRKGNVNYIAVPTNSVKKIKHIEQYFYCISDSVIKNALDLLRNSLISDVVLTDGLKNEINFLINKTQPKAIWAHTLRWGSDAMLGEVSQKYRIPCTLISHGSHSKPTNITSASEHIHLMHGLLFSPLASNNLLQSPHAERAIKSFKKIYPCSRSRPIMWGYRQVKTLPNKRNFRTILHAGTYKIWSNTRPWIFETSDEFVLGLVKLIQAVEQLEGTKLIIRFRIMAECQLKSLKQLLPKSNCYEIKTSGEFLEDLAKADLLVSFASTTTEEALYARRPVLLWGGSKRYYHLPANETCPTENSRRAIYAPKTEKELLPMLESILKFHTGKPLTEKELKDHVWFENVPGKKEFLKQLVI